MVVEYFQGTFQMDLFINEWKTSNFSFIFGRKWFKRIFFVLALMDETNGLIENLLYKYFTTVFY